MSVSTNSNNRKLTKTTAVVINTVERGTHYIQTLCTNPLRALANPPALKRAINKGGTTKTLRSITSARHPAQISLP